MLDRALRYYTLILDIITGILRGVMIDVFDCDIVVSEFELQSCYHVHFRTNTLGRVMNPLIPQMWVK